MASESGVNRKVGDDGRDNDEYDGWEADEGWEAEAEAEADEDDGGDRDGDTERDAGEERSGEEEDGEGNVSFDDGREETRSERNSKCWLSTRKRRGEMDAYTVVTGAGFIRIKNNKLAIVGSSSESVSGI